MQNNARTGTIYHGNIVYWNDQKGYGFIATGEDEPNTFFHISTFLSADQRPQKGDAVSFTRQSEGEKPSAERVVLRDNENTLTEPPETDKPAEKPFKAEGIIYILADISFFILLASANITIALTCAIISVLTVALYSYDKHAAIFERQRIPEASLHLAALLGGWPGALIARPLLRHKTRKTRFILFFWMSIVVNISALYALIWYLSKHN